MPTPIRTETERRRRMGLVHAKVERKSRQATEQAKRDKMMAHSQETFSKELQSFYPEAIYSGKPRTREVSASRNRLLA